MFPEKFVKRVFVGAVRRPTFDGLSLERPFVPPRPRPGERATAHLLTFFYGSLRMRIVVTRAKTDTVRARCITATPGLFTCTQDENKADWVPLQSGTTFKH